MKSYQNWLAFPGKCIEVDPNGLYKPSKQCFCEAGRMGLNCEKESSIKDKAFKAEDYSRYRKLLTGP